MFLFLKLFASQERIFHLKFSSCKKADSLTVLCLSLRMDLKFAGMPWLLGAHKGPDFTHKPSISV